MFMACQIAELLSGHLVFQEQLPQGKPLKMAEG
jgi:hypothetical protein